MRFYSTQRKHYCGVDLHAKTMYVCIIDQQARIVNQKNIKRKSGQRQSSQLSAVSVQLKARIKKLKPFRDLNVWAKAHSLTLKVYKATSSFPREEVYGLTSQIWIVYKLRADCRELNNSVIIKCR